MANTSTPNTIVASSPGDIVIQILQQNTGSGGAPAQIIPLKTFTWTETNGVTSEFAIGNHEKYAQVQGKKEYKLDMELASWFVSARDNPQTWEHLLNDMLLYKNDQRLSREFDVLIMAREGGDYQSQVSSPMKSASGTIDTFSRCILTDSGGNVPEVGGTVTRKYSAVCFTIISDASGASAYGSPAF